MIKLPALGIVALSCLLFYAPAAVGKTSGNKTVFVGAIRGVYQLAAPANSMKLRATGQVGLFLTAPGLSHVLFTKAEDWNGSDATAQGIVNTFSRTDPSILEGYLDYNTTPSVPAQHWNYTRPDGWHEWAARLGWKPSIFLLNMNAHGTAATSMYTAADVQDVLSGSQDIKKSTPYVKFVFPYLSPNAGIYGSWEKDVYWSTARQLAIAQGGFVIDVPVGYYLRNSRAYQKVVTDQIIWAVRHRLIVGVLLSPCSTNPQDWIIVHSCSFSPDPYFMDSTKRIVTNLEATQATPTMWLVDNYSEQAVSPYPGTDNRNSTSYNPNTILAVGLWIAENAKTSPYPPAAITAPGQSPNPAPGPSARGSSP